MSRFDTWIKRIRTMGEHKTHERVLAHGKYEILTSTQACRFKQLQGLRIGRGAKSRVAPQTKPHYPLPEACARLGSSVSAILLSAAADQLTCFVLAAGLRGRWLAEGEQDAGRSGAAVEMPKYLALSAADCRDIESYGSVNVSALKHPSAPARDEGRPAERTLYRLLEPLWVDPERVVLLHPLPVPGAS